MPDAPYTNQFFEELHDGSIRSAREIMPLVFELLRAKSIVDIGCDAGIWLSVCRELGIDDIFGVDGDYVDDKLLQYSKSASLPSLRNPFRLGRRFDQVLSLEGAEHLPAEFAATFIDSLTADGDVIALFGGDPLSRRDALYKRTVAGLLARFFSGTRIRSSRLHQKKDLVKPERGRLVCPKHAHVRSQDQLEAWPLLEREFENTAVSQLSIVHPKNDT